MSNLIVTMPDPHEIQLQRTFAAPRHLVIEAMTTPELVKRWLGGKRANVLAADIDLRVGGTYRYVFENRRGGGTFSFSGVYREITPDRVVFTQQMNDDPGAAVVTTTYVEDRGTTTMTVSIRFDSPQLRDMVAATGMADGAGESYDVLETVVASLR